MAMMTKGEIFMDFIAYSGSHTHHTLLLTMKTANIKPFENIPPYLYAWVEVSSVKAPPRSLLLITHTSSADIINSTHILCRYN